DGLEFLLPRAPVHEFVLAVVVLEGADGAADDVDLAAEILDAGHGPGAAEALVVGVGGDHQQALFGKVLVTGGLGCSHAAIPRRWLQSVEPWWRGCSGEPPWRVRSRP